jgi:hypothetical protein
MAKTEINFNIPDDINTFLGMAKHDDCKITELFPNVFIEGWWRTIDFNVKCNHYNPDEKNYVFHATYRALTHYAEVSNHYCQLCFYKKLAMWHIVNKKMGFTRRDDAFEFTHLNIDNINLDDYTFDNTPQYLHTHSTSDCPYKINEKIIYKINNIEFFYYK